MRKTILVPLREITVRGRNISRRLNQNFNRLPNGLLRTKTNLLMKSWWSGGRRNVPGRIQTVGKERKRLETADSRAVPAVKVFNLPRNGFYIRDRDGKIL